MVIQSNIFNKNLRLIILLSGSFMLISCSESESHSNANRVELEVTATAYTSHISQTDETPFLAAWNNELKPGVKSIAVSRDLLNMGLKNGSKVKIEGLEGEYLVLDKMHKRWQKKIDIYMGTHHKKAKKWGKQTVTISWVKE